MSHEQSIPLNEQNFADAVLGSDQPVLVDFSAAWCGPCQLMKPVVEKLADEYEGRAKVGVVDIDTNQALSARFGVMAVPTFLFFQNGQVVDRLEGAAPPHALIGKLDRLLAA